MKKAFSNIITILACILIILFPIIKGITSLADKKNHHTDKIYAASAILEIEHSINGLIPTGKDYYYIGVSDDGKTGYIISGPKNWGKENFDTNGIANEDGGVEIKGHVKRISDYKVRNEIVNSLQQLDNIDFILGADVCLDVSYKSNAVKGILAGVLVLISSVVGFLCLKTGLFAGNRKILIIDGVLLIIGLFLTINTLR